MSNLSLTKDCWNYIGVTGDRTCPELQIYIHCRNCSVYSTGGRNLLEREAPVDYVNEWTHLLADTQVSAIRRVAHTNTISVVIFRLGLEWLALPASLFKEVTPVTTIHTLPHRSNAILLGITNIRGEIQMCISLGALLQLETAPIATHNHTSPVVYKRMLVVEKEGNCWVFPVDEIYGIQRFTPDELRNVPATVSRVPETYAKGMIHWREQNVSYLDDELLFYTLNKKVL